jgi:flavin-dependent dehydrogenase
MIYDVIIIGGGLSGLINAIELGRGGLRVLLIEKKDYPQHRVCGEYVSNEVLPYLKSLGFDPFNIGAKNLSRFQLSSNSGLIAETELPLGGFGLSRFAFDEALYKIALSHSVSFCLNESAEQVEEINGIFKVKTQKGKEYESKLVLGAQGKRSVLDKNLNRNFINKRTAYFAVKAHYSGDFPDDLVSLHNFKGGYCGLSMIENGHINVCYLSWESHLKKYGDISSMEKQLLSQNPFLKKVFNEWEPVFKTPLTISQIYFNQKDLANNGILMSGDAAGLIYPLCGNGMAMAIHAGKILSELVLEFSNDKLSRLELEQKYQKEWKRNFSGRLFAGSTLQHFFGNTIVSGTAVRLLKTFPGIGKKVIQATHGKEINI